MRKLAVLLVLAIYVFLPTIPASSSETPQAIPSAPLGTTDYPWSMFHHDSQRTGTTPASAPSQPGLMWSFDTRATIYSSPAVVNGVVYITTYDWVYNTGTLYAIDEYTGQQRWMFPTSRPIYASPAVANGIVYVAARDGFLYALSEQNGALLWQRGNPNFPITSSPAVANGKIFYGTWFVQFWAQLIARDANN